MKKYSKPFRLAIVRSHPTQYFAPLYRALANEPELDLQVFFARDNAGRGKIDPEFQVPVEWDVPLLEGYQNEFLPNSPLPFHPSHIFQYRCPSLWKRLEEQKVDAVFSAGYSTYLEWQTLSFALSKGTPLLMRPEAHSHKGNRPFLKSKLRTLVLQALYKRVGAYLAIGQQAKHHYLELGGAPEKLFFSPYCVDNYFFREAATKLPSKSEIKAQLGFTPNQQVALFCAKLVPKKEPLLLAQALTQMKHKNKIGLLVVGEGALHNDFEKLVAQAGINHFKFVGFKNQTELPYYYKGSDFLVLPSSLESWGLVVNEAMNFSLPSLVSDVVGCREDLIIEDKTGLSFNNRSREDLAAKLDILVNTPQQTAEMGKEALKQIDAYSVQHAVKGFNTAISYIRAGSHHG